MAFDLGFSSGMRGSYVRPSTEDPAHSCREYAKTKIAYKETGAKCEAAGFAFVPLTFEPHGGGFGPAVSDLIARLAQLRTAQGAHAAQGHSLRIAERVSNACQQATARALLKRLAPTPLSSEAPAVELRERWEVR